MNRNWARPQNWQAINLSGKSSQFDLRGSNFSNVFNWLFNASPQNILPWRFCDGDILLWLQMLKLACICLGHFLKINFKMEISLQGVYRAMPLGTTTMGCEGSLLMQAAPGNEAYPGPGCLSREPSAANAASSWGNECHSPEGGKLRDTDSIPITSTIALPSPNLFIKRLV